MIDLWEEGCREMDIINMKNIQIEEMTSDLEHRIKVREGLEDDNQGLRDTMQRQVIYFLCALKRQLSPQKSFYNLIL